MQRKSQQLQAGFYEQLLPLCPVPPVLPGFNLLLFLFFDALNHDSESPFKKAGVRRRAACCRVNLEGLHWEGG